MLTAAVLAVLAGACGGATEPARVGVPVAGTWRYVAQQTAPTDVALQGTLVLDVQGGSRISGSIDAVQSSASGTGGRLAGPLSGRYADSTTLDLEWALGAITRRHLGTVRRDSIVGTWVELPTAGGAATASGSFRAARTP